MKQFIFCYHCVRQNCEATFSIIAVVDTTGIISHHHLQRRGLFSGRFLQAMTEKKIDKELIRHIALLARIEMTDEQADTLGRQFAEIVAFVDKLGELDTDGVEPMAHALDVRNVLAEDAPGESLPVERALANAPARDGDFYKVPKVIGDSQ